MLLCMPPEIHLGITHFDIKMGAEELKGHFGTVRMSLTEGGRGGFKKQFLDRATHSGPILNQRDMTVTSMPSNGQFNCSSNIHPVPFAAMCPPTNNSSSLPLVGGQFRADCVVLFQPLPVHC